MNVDNGAIRELLKNEQPTAREVTWEEGSPISDLNQVMIARAVLKRLRRQVKRAEPQHKRKLLIRCNAIRFALNSYHNR